MKKVKFIILLLSLASIMPIYASSYTVSGAGTSGANGIYLETSRTFNGKPVYEKGEYRLGYRNCSAKWVIVDGNDDDNIGDGKCPLYKNYNNTSTVSLSGWLVGDVGNSPAPTISEYSGLSYEPETFTESTDNDGSIGNTIIITYSDPGTDYFTGSNGTFSSDKYTASNVPAGLTMVITKFSDTELSVELSGIASNHTNSGDISNLEIAFNDNAFNDGDALVVTNSTKSDLEVNYREVYTVASSGGDYSTIASAISSVDDGDILNLAAETFTEAGLTIDKDLIIIGQGASSTIVQAHATQGSATSRVFTINSGLSVIIKNITIRNGKTISAGGGIYFDGEELTIVNSVISNNISDYHGGGIYNKSSGTLVIENSTVNNNTCPQAWSRGGGICSEHGSLLMSNSTISGNQCTGSDTKGGGISGQGTITNTTITENSCTENGAALFTYGVTLNNCTVKDNSTGVYYYMGTLTVCNTIIVDNGSYDYNGESTSLTDNGYNIVENSSKAANAAGGFNNATTILYNTKYNDSGTSFSSWSQGGSVLVNQNLNLSSTLADNNSINGTQTLALLSGSFAIDNGTGSGVDQRGVAVFNGVKDIGAYEYNTAWVVWQGSASSDCATSGNWSCGSVPGSSQDIGISPCCTHAPSLSSPATYRSLNIPENASLNIANNGELTLTGNLNNDGVLLLQSTADGTGSLIVNGSSSGDITAECYMTGASTGWHLTAAPVGGQNIQELIDNANNSFSTNGSQYGLGVYNEATNTWTTYTTETYSSAGSLVAGQGYETNIQNDGTIEFEGTLATSQVDVSITKTGNGWNLLGNPYPCALYANNDADASNNFITVNAAVLDDAYEALYFWDAASSEYLIVNNSVGDPVYIPNGQAFFVKSVDGGGTASFTTAMRIHQPGAAFKSNTANANIILKAANGERAKITEFRFIEGTTLGLDPGYDAGLFNGTKDDFVLSSRLMQDNGVSFALQCLPSDDFENAAIPIELNSVTSTIEFSVEANNLPSNIKVYLEDKQDNSFSLLDGSQTYTTQVNIGETPDRFYLHTSQQALDQLSELNDGEYEIIPQVQSSTLLICGEITEGTRLSIVDLTGRVVFETNVSSSTINVPSLSNGIYIVKLGAYSQKINWIK